MQGIQVCTGGAFNPHIDVEFGVVGQGFQLSFSVHTVIGRKAGHAAGECAFVALCGLGLGLWFVICIGV